MAEKISIESVSSQIEKIGKKMDEGFFALMEAVAELRGRTASLEDTQEEILEKLEPLSKAHDKDSEALVDYGRRISRIEKHVNVGRG